MTSSSVSSGTRELSRATALALLFATLFFEAASTAAITSRTGGLATADVAPSSASLLHVLLSLGGLLVGAALSMWRHPRAASLVGALGTAFAAVLATLGGAAAVAPAGALAAMSHPLAVVGLLAALAGLVPAAQPNRAMALFIVTAVLFDLAARPTVLGLGAATAIAYGVLALLTAVALAFARAPSEAPDRGRHARLAAQTAFAGWTLAFAATTALVRPPVGEEPGVPYLFFCAIPVLLLAAVPLIRRMHILHWMGVCLALVAVGLWDGAVPWIPRWITLLSLTVGQFLLLPITLAWVTSGVRPRAAAASAAVCLAVHVVLPRLLAAYVMPELHRLVSVAVLAVAIGIIVGATRIDALRVVARPAGPSRF